MTGDQCFAFSLAEYSANISVLSGSFNQNTIIWLLYVRLKKCTQIIYESLLFTLQTSFWAWVTLSITLDEMFTPASAIVAKCRRHSRHGSSERFRGFRVQFHFILRTATAQNWSVILYIKTRVSNDGQHSISSWLYNAILLRMQWKITSQFILKC
jgi:hypothetical protein